MATLDYSFRRTAKGRFCKSAQLFCPEANWADVKAGKISHLSISTNDEGTTFINEVETIKLDLSKFKKE